MSLSDSESWMRSSGRLARFHREAQVVAALNHPNIAHNGRESQEKPGRAPGFKLQQVLRRVTAIQARRPEPEVRNLRTRGDAALLRTFEQPAVNRLPEHVSLDRLHHIGSRLEGVSGWLHIDHRVERVDLKHVVVFGTVRGGTGPAVHLAGRADLEGAIGEF